MYAAIDARTLFLLALTLLLTAIFAVGLVYRQRRGIGFEGMAIVAVYLAGVAGVAAMP